MARHSTTVRSRSRRRILSIVAVIVGVALIGMAAAVSATVMHANAMHRIDQTQSVSSRHNARRSSSPATSARARQPQSKSTPLNTANPQELAKRDRQQTLDSLSNQLQQKISGYDGHWQVYVEDLPTGAAISINNHQQYSASVIKLMVMLAVFQRIHDGTFPDTAEVDHLLTQMITVSSNEATNTLVDELGGGDTQAGYDTVNTIAKQYGFAQSHLNQRMGDLTGNTGKQTSVDDQGRFLAAACRGQLVSAQYSQRMIDLMLGQQRRSKIPAGLPSQISVANKTGESPGVENDSAMVFASNDGQHITGSQPGRGDYVIAVMSEDINSSSTAQANIRDISASTWAILQ